MVRYGQCYKFGRTTVSELCRFYLIVFQKQKHSFFYNSLSYDFVPLPIPLQRYRDLPSVTITDLYRYNRYVNFSNNNLTYRKTPDMRYTGFKFEKKANFQFKWSMNWFFRIFCIFFIGIKCQKMSKCYLKLHSR